MCVVMCLTIIVIIVVDNMCVRLMCILNVSSVRTNVIHDMTRTRLANLIIHARRI